MQLTTAAREKHELQVTLKAVREAAAAEEKQLRAEIQKCEALLNMSADGLDAGMVALAKTIVRATDYERGGDERASCIKDAIKQFSTGEPVRKHYGDLWHVCFATKNYDCWRGQRSDHEYGFGPKHGSICFEVGLTQETRKRAQCDLSPEEVEATIYYLLNIERIQAAEKTAAKMAAAE